MAALTLPSVITNYQKKAAVSQLKKVYSQLSNAVKMSETVNGEMADWDFPDGYYTPDIIPFFQKYYKPYLNVVSECQGESLNCFVRENYIPLLLNGSTSNGAWFAGYIAKLADGSYIYTLSSVSNGYIWLFADVNGAKKPNVVGKDIFVFDIYSYPNTRDRKMYKLKFWNEQYINTSDLLTVGDYACNTIKSVRFSGFNCGAYLMKNNWVMPDDYPW